MDTKLIIMLLATLACAYELLLNIVQYRSANNPTPKNVSDVYDKETYQRWKQYSAEKCRLQIAGTLVSWAIVMVTLAFNVHSAVAGLLGDNIYLQLIAVLVFQAVVDAAFGAVIGYKDTMVIEQKYGFNRSTMKTFVVDQVRNNLISMLISILLMSLLAWLHTSLGDGMVLLFAGVIFLFTLLISFVFPYISRMSNKFTPLEDGELKDKLTALLTSHGYQVRAIEVMDASRRTTKSNAYFTGFGKTKTIVLYDTLIEAMTADEICAIFAHELGHGLHKDVPKQQAMNLVNLLILAVLAWLAVRTDVMHTAFGFTQVNYGFAYLLLGAALLPLVQPLTGMLMSAYSRRAEYRADRQAVQEGYGEALVTGLKKLAKENFSHLAPSKLLVVLAYSHPPMSERIAAIEAADKRK